MAHWLTMKPIAKQTGEETGFAIERFLPFRLSVLSNRLTRAVARVYTRRFRLSAPEWRTLAVLGRYGAMSANSVVDRTAMDKVRVSRAVARLTTAGHITRRTDPERPPPRHSRPDAARHRHLSADRAAGARGGE